MVIRDLTQSGPSNRGGSYVSQYSHRAEVAGGHVLSVTGPDGAIAQIKLTDPSYTLRGALLMSHHLYGAGPHPTPETSALLELLRGAVTVRCGNSLDFALALDWYNTIVDDALGGYTPLADLVNRGKYRYLKNPDLRAKLREVGRAVVGELAEFISQHPLLKDVDAIAAAPGHDARVLSFGSLVAASVAHRRNVSLIRCESQTEFRASAKNLDLADRAGALEGQFRCPVDLSGNRVLIVDDVYSSGATAEETGRALRAAGAAGVASLAAVRTMRSN